MEMNGPRAKMIFQKMTKYKACNNVYHCCNNRAENSIKWTFNENSATYNPFYGQDPDGQVQLKGI
ncbi:hypothetical protein CQA01_27870 [Cyclobacterium qasimii]|uniref:Uncharacterized protein n=2 Tax=Cyclobacterium qasimii TaxID=1350429 RepID=A0A512CDH3_9BACT|nr:hypothetical protein CQA01_27870 [Cyclobacterium qasimii]